MNSESLLNELRKLIQLDVDAAEAYEQALKKHRQYYYPY